MMNTAGESVGDRRKPRAHQVPLLLLIQTLTMSLLINIHQPP